MKRLFLLAGTLLLSACAASATTTQKWTAGWDNFSEPLNYTKSHVTWSVNTTTRKLSLTYKLVGATPNKLYQVGIVVFCTTFPQTFGQFPTGVNGNCDTITRQGVTKTSTQLINFGVVTTDIYGNGSFAVVVGPIASGTYDVEFGARDGVYQNGSGCCGNNGADFQSPGPTWGDSTTITIP
jgi:hypothetical protein